MLILVSNLLNHNNNDDGATAFFILLKCSKEERTEKEIDDYRNATVSILLPKRNLKKEAHERDDENVLLFLLSVLLSKHINDYNKNNNVTSILIQLLKLLKHTNYSDENIINSKENNILILLRNLLIRNISNKGYRDDSIVLIQDEPDKNSISFIDINAHNIRTSKDGEYALLSKLFKCNDNNNNNDKCIEYVLILLSKLSKRIDDDNIDCGISNNTNVITLLSDKERIDKSNRSYNDNNDHNCTVHNEDNSDNFKVLITYGKYFFHDTSTINTNVFIINTSVLTLLSKLGGHKSNHYTFVSRKDDDINDKNKTYNDECNDNNNCNISSTDNGNSNSNDSDNNIKMCIDCNDDIMKNMKNKNKININNTTITSSDDNSDINTAQPRLFMASVGTQLSCLVLKMESLIVLATCIIRYKYDTILEALFVFHCSILYRIFTIDGEYQNLQRARILVDDISLYKSSWNRALRLEPNLSSSRQMNAAKMSQILHVM